MLSKKSAAPQMVATWIACKCSVPNESATTVAIIELNRETLPDFVNISKYGHVVAGLQPPKYHKIHKKMLKYNEYRLLVSLMQLMPHYFHSTLYVNKEYDLLKIKWRVNQSFIYMTMMTAADQNESELKTTAEAGSVLCQLMQMAQASDPANCCCGTRDKTHMLPIVQFDKDLNGSWLTNVLKSRTQLSIDTPAYFYVPGDPLCSVVPPAKPAKTIEDMTTDEYFEYLFDVGPSEPQTPDPDVVYVILAGELAYNYTQLKFQFLNPIEPALRKTSVIVLDKAREPTIDAILIEVGTWIATGSTATDPPLVVICPDIWEHYWLSFSNFHGIRGDTEQPVGRFYLIPESTIESMDDNRLVAMLLKYSMIHPLATILYNCRMSIVARVVTLTCSILGPYIIMSSEMSNDPRFLTHNLSAVLKCAGAEGYYVNCEHRYKDQLKDISRTMGLRYRHHNIWTLFNLTSQVSIIPIATLHKAQPTVVLRISKSATCKSNTEVTTNRIFKSNYAPSWFKYRAVRVEPFKKFDAKTKTFVDFDLYQVNCRHCSTPLDSRIHDFCINADALTEASCIYCHILGQYRRFENAAFYKAQTWTSINPEWGPFFEWMLYENIMVRLMNNLMPAARKYKGYIVYNDEISAADVVTFSNITRATTNNKVFVYYFDANSSAECVSEVFKQSDKIAVIFATRNTKILRIFNFKDIIETAFVVNYHIPLGFNWPELHPCTIITFVFVHGPEFYASADDDDGKLEATGATGPSGQKQKPNLKMISTSSETQDPPLIRTRSQYKRIADTEHLMEIIPNSDAPETHLVTMSSERKKQLLKDTMDEINAISSIERSQLRPEICKHCQSVVY